MRAQPAPPRAEGLDVSKVEVVGFPAELASFPRECLALSPRRTLLGTDVFRPLSGEHPEDETIQGLLILRTEGCMTFANAARAGELECCRNRVIVVHCAVGSRSHKVTRYLLAQGFPRDMNCRESMWRWR